MGNKKAKQGNPPRKFRVKYARIVLMEAVVKARSADDVKDDGLPGVFDGIPTEMVGKHVKDVQDHEFVWEVAEAGRQEEAGRKAAIRGAIDKGEVGPVADDGRQDNKAEALR